MAGQIDHMLAGAAAGLDRIAGFPGEESLQHGPDRLMVAVKCRRIEPPIGFGGPAILTEFNDIFSHAGLPYCLATKVGLTRHGANRKALTQYRADYRIFDLSRCAARRRRHPDSPPALSANGVYALTNYIQDQ
jgi:hypothetical protein